MLARSRIIAIILVGVGTALLAVGTLLPRFIDGSPKLPLDIPPLSYTLRAEDGISTRFNEEGQREEVFSPIRRQLHGELIEPADSEKVSLRVGVTEMREQPAEVLGTDPLTELVDAVVWTFTIDRLTGEFVAPATIVDRMAGVPRDVQVSGNWVKLPTNTQQQTYEIFDDFYRGSLPANYVETQQRGETELYLFRQEIAPTNLAERYRSYNTMVDFGDQTGFLHYAGVRDYLVEPKSGAVVYVREDIDLWWQNRQGERLMTYLRFNGAMSDEDSNMLLAGALHNFTTKPLRPWSIALITVGAIITFAGTVGAVRPSRNNEKGSERV